MPRHGGSGCCAVRLREAAGVSKSPALRYFDPVRLGSLPKSWIPTSLPPPTPREPPREVGLHIEQVKLSNFGLSDDPEQPVRSLIAREFIERLNLGISILQDSVHLAQEKNHNPAVCEMVFVRASKALEYFEQVNELLDWLGVNSKHIPRKMGGFIHLNPLSGASSAGNRESRVPQSSIKHSAGRPNENPTYVALFELMLQSPRTSLGKALQMLKPPLPAERRASLKAGILKLKKLLRVYAPEILEQYEKLHPDRAKKPMGNK